MDYIPKARLFVGPKTSSLRGINTIVNCGVEKIPYSTEGVNYLFLSMEDDEEQKIETVAKKFLDFMTKNYIPEQTLIHCAMGISRSVSMTILWMIHSFPELSVDEALTLIKKSRPIADPRSNFIEDLNLWKNKVKCLEEDIKYEEMPKEKKLKLKPKTITLSLV